MTAGYRPTFDDAVRTGEIDPHEDVTPQASAAVPEALRLAEKAKLLLTAATNASFACGEWNAETDEDGSRTYGELHAVSMGARDAVRSAIDALAALAQPRQAAVEVSQQAEKAQAAMQRVHNHACAARYMAGSRTVVPAEVAISALQEVYASQASTASEPLAASPAPAAPVQAEATPALCPMCGTGKVPVCSATLICETCKKEASSQPVQASAEPASVAVAEVTDAMVLAGLHAIHCEVNGYSHDSMRKSITAALAAAPGAAAPTGKAEGSGLSALDQLP